MAALRSLDRKPCVLLLFDPSPFFPGLLASLQRSFTVLRYDGTILTDRAPLEPIVAAQVEALVSTAASADLIDSLPNLRTVQCVSSGVDRVDMAACRRRCVSVTNLPSVASSDVADLAILFMLAACRQLRAAHEFVRQGLWSIKGGDFLLASKASGKRVGIIGLGGIGLCIAKRAAAFGCAISYHGKSRKPNTPYTYYGNVVEMATDCSVLFISCALTEETLHMVDVAVLNALGPQGILVNVAPGEVVKEVDLIRALTEGRLGFAALDVFEKEPHINAELLSLPNVLLTPHMGTGSRETRTAMEQVIVGNLEAFFSSNALLTPDN